MTISRQVFLQRMRQAVAQGNQAGLGGTARTIPPRGSIGYQGAGSHPVERFCEGLAVAGGQAYVVPDREAAITQILDLVEEKAPRTILLGQSDFLDSLGLLSWLEPFEGDVLTPGKSQEISKDQLFAADLGISPVDYLIAETGSLVVAAKPHDPRSLSLLPPVHIAAAQKSQIVPDLFDLFQKISPSQQTLPSGLSLITGPSKTGDIELRLVTGVHGPKEVHVVLVES